MKKATGYRGMLRDRIPKMVDYALKWKKSKERWIDHVYDNFIGIFVDNEERKKATRAVLCLRYTKVKQGKHSKVIETQNFDFHRTINWDDLMPEEQKDWEIVEHWIKWFRSEYAYAENAYKISKQTGKSEFNIKVELIHDYLMDYIPDESGYVKAFNVTLETEEQISSQIKNVDNLSDFLIRCFENRI